MKMVKFIRLPVRIIFLGIIPIIISCNSELNKKSRAKFSFVFMSDIHVQPESNATKGFQAAIDKANSLKPDFVLTGGDLIMDALGQTYGRADSLYDLYQNMLKSFKMPVFNTMGNHEIFGIYNINTSDSLNPEYGEKMFEKRLGKSYYTFDHKGWKFFVLNSVEDTKKGGYIGLLDSVQMKWLGEELSKTDKSTPLVISTHIPLLSIFKQMYYGSTLATDSSLVVANSKEIMDKFQDYNLKLVLQGHLHTVEDIFVNGTHFIVGGAVSGAWWEGPNKGFEEGFIKIDVEGDRFNWQFIDYGWDAGKR